MAIGKERSKEEKMVVRQQRQRLCPQGYNVELAPHAWIPSHAMVCEREREREREREQMCLVVRL
ncbi:unnamed protein product [Musa acuminata subsp. burmannicoides]